MSLSRLVCDRLPSPPESPAPSAQNVAVQAALATVPLPPSSGGALPYPTNERATQHDADVMQALRSLHDDAAVDLPTHDRRAASTAAPNEPSLLQTYSYTLRSHEPPSPSLAPEQRDALAQKTVDPTRSPSTLLPSELAANQSGRNDDRPQAGSIAASDARSHDEQALPIASSNLADTTSLSVSNSTPTPPINAQTASIARILQQLDNQELSAKTMFPGFGLLACTLKPQLKLHLTTCYQPIWLTDPSSNQPIHQFTPAPEASDFHSKLKAVAQPPDKASGVEAGPPSHAS